MTAVFGEGFGLDGGTRAAKLTDKFIVPPFSVLDTRQGYWQERKRAWLALGIQSELGRDAVAYEQQAALDGYRLPNTAGKAFNMGLKASKGNGWQLEDDQGSGTSIFDPVLCELVYRWFAPEGGTVLDPFAGGSVRGLVAASLGHPYIGIDLSARQIEANRAQLGLLPSTAPLPEWIVGDSAARLADVPDGADLVFSCPPYFDLEVYSDDPADLSAMSWPAFMDAYDLIIERAVARLRRGRFAVFVVSEVRGPTGTFRGLVPHTIHAFERAGAAFYNEIILVNAIGSLPIRITRQFESGRKIGRTHQNVLVFVKGGAPEKGWSYDREAPADPQVSLWGEPAPAALPVPVAAGQVELFDEVLAALHAIEAMADAPLAAWVCDTCRRSVPAGPITTRQDDLAHGSGPCYVCDEPTRWSR